ncbi:MAG: hypothetical protein ACP5NC_06515, partial [Nitrososphaeria archaeon]
DRDFNSGIDNDAKGHKEVMALGTTLMPVDDETTTVMLEYLKGVPHVASSIKREVLSFSWA